MCGGELDGQRQTVQAPADVGHRRGVVTVEDKARVGRPGPVHEQPHPVVAGHHLRARVQRPAGTIVGRRAGHLQRRNRPDQLTRHAQHLTAGQQHPQSRGAPQQAHDQVRAAVDDVFAVVQHEQQDPIPEDVDEPVGRIDRRCARRAGLVAHAQRDRHGLGRQPGTCQGGQLDQPHPVGKLGRQPPGRLDGHAGLAGSTRSGHGDQPMPADQLGRLGQVPVPAYQAGKPLGQVVLRCRRRTGAARCRDGRILGEDRPVNPLELGRRVDAEFLGQRRAGPAVHQQRLGLPTAAVEREHELTA
jgi:hypothetical protein